MGAYHFDERYAEEAELRDGSRVRLRLIRPEDKDLMARAFERLSPESRYRRFFCAKSSLSGDELRYLTELDHVNHFALGATRDLPSGAEEGVAVARFVRLPTEPTCAEAAIVVADDLQGKGLGRLLLRRLVAAARERGIERFRAGVLADNEPMRALIRATGKRIEEREDGPEVLVDMELPDIAPTTGPTGRLKRTTVYELLAAAARGIATVGTALHILDRREE